MADIERAIKQIRERAKELADEIADEYTGEIADAITSRCQDIAIEIGQLLDLDLDEVSDELLPLCEEEVEKKVRVKILKE